MTIPSVYQGLTPSPVAPSLTPFQLALASYMFQGTIPPFFINQSFLGTLKDLSDSAALSPATIDPKTGEPRVPDIAIGLTGIGYISLGDEIFLLRYAQDCGPEETNRYEYVSVGKRSKVAIGTFAYYGGPVDSGTVSQGSGEWGVLYNTNQEQLNRTFVNYEATF